MEKWYVSEYNKDYKKVFVIAEIRNNLTNEIREYETIERLENDEEFPNIFNWEENNYSCDCNRGIFFNKSIEMDEECSDGKYSVNLKNKLDGKYYYKEY